MKKLIAVFLIAVILCVSLSGCSLIDRINAGAYTEGDRVITSEVNKIDIDWAKGEIVIRPSSNAEGIRIHEVNTTNVPVATRLIGSTLYIKDSKPGTETSTKTLMVTVPDSCSLNEIEIRTESADASVAGMTVGRTDILTDSGDITVVGCTITDEAELGTTSGNVLASGRIVDYDIQSVDGDIVIRAASNPKDLDTDTISGNVLVQLPEGSQFRAKINTEGEITHEFDLKQKGKTFICGEGGDMFRFNSKTGSVSIDIK